MTALHSDRPENLRLLLRCGADPAQADGAGNPALHIAAQISGKRRWCPIDFSGSGGFSDVRFF